MTPRTPVLVPQASGPDLVVIQRNPHAGTGQRKAQLLELVKQLRRRGLKPRLFRHREKLRNYVSIPERLARLRCLVAAGGDGTVGDLITRFPGVPLAVFPMGTENLFAKFLKIPRSGRALADLIVDGELQTHDLAQIGARRFCLMAGIGLDAEIVHDVHRRRRGNIRKWQYIPAIWRAWQRSLSQPLLQVRCDEEPLIREGRAAFVLNQPIYALGFQLVPPAAPLAGQLAVRVSRWSSRWELLWLAWRAWLGRWDELPQTETANARQQVIIDSPTPVKVQVDGDPCGETPVVIELLPRALQVYAPQMHGSAGTNSPAKPS